MTPEHVHDPLGAFARELSSGGIVTQVLERRAGGRVRAEAVGSTSVTVDAAIRDLLGCAANDVVAHRATRLMHGEVELSDADLWYLPSRLTPEINHALTVGDTPFGRAIQSLAPTRRTLLCERLWGGSFILRVRAVVLDGEGRALALVDERYLPVALGRVQT
ncbi:hypothetical protein M9980_01740 [Sphingomonas donggukensis]|uniref:Chorismate lyase n=1 Tax=Sphingomonas donggukensis TaxID=2949093 RepID=A0ABY4TUA8_9SPHN|nr:hypothetical protein [Sphingomonas donggukensis]URW75977.1 hypothetical protein M9980_01740 [Sphingomonas donggukensis]